jgi:threonine dehydrogenase-like Zn-dependent dehydrogenase
MGPGLYVIFGTGAIGLATFEALRRRGATARLVNRSGRAHVPDGVDVAKPSKPTKPLVEPIETPGELELPL